MTAAVRAAAPFQLPDDAYLTVAFKSRALHPVQCISSQFFPDCLEDVGSRNKRGTRRAVCLARTVLETRRVLVEVVIVSC
ncbi:hypothetical protein AYM40_07600 [Paraburkholderia phytofirmans OLGA172]|uniref:Uncharacterized protein n=1 Tax=Paraburkholderia phytofirmans OLGA172 TaxID=1417228 RepID=A0A160FIV9_9BURK|nr:hypothetical protein AYM40_07600 [Paraburkholderia phytofirmans OLGA172]